MNLITRNIALAAGLLLAMLASATIARAEVRLVMFDDTGCYWCDTWKEEIGPIYPKTAEGRMAPLQMIHVGDPLPEGMELQRDVHFTPTFVLVNDGVEVARIEGYPGEDFFWGLLENLLQQAEVQVAESG